MSLQVKEWTQFSRCEMPILRIAYGRRASDSRWCQWSASVRHLVGGCISAEISKGSKTAPIQYTGENGKWSCEKRVCTAKYLPEKLTQFPIKLLFKKCFTIIKTYNIFTYGVVCLGTLLINTLNIVFILFYVAFRILICHLRYFDHILITESISGYIILKFLMCLHKSYDTIWNFIVL